MSKTLIDLYCGFFIEEAVGNNSFSFSDRKQRQIHVPAIKECSLNDIRVGQEIVFSEIEDGQEINVCGLEFHAACRWQDKHLRVVDNHNHVFFHWFEAVASGKIPAGLPLVHIDQHSDLRYPDQQPPVGHWSEWSLEQAFEYTNYKLNVGNFIRPAQHLGLISEVIQVTGSNDLLKPLPDDFILDLDLDFFAPVLDYIPFRQKKHFIQEAAAQARLITVASSPFFMDQTFALQVLSGLFNEQL